MVFRLSLMVINIAYFFLAVSLLVSKLNFMLGPDIDNRGEYKINENGKYENDEYIRK